MITFRPGQAADWKAVAQLHTKSWQGAYRGILSDAFLDEELWDNRRAYWEARFKAGIPPTIFPRNAEQEKQMVGFVCAVADADPEWGTLIDNLHVLPGAQQRGLGRQLMQQAARWVSSLSPSSETQSNPMYLWVYRDNTKARAFYERIHGKAVESKSEQQPDGGMAAIVRYAWSWDATEQLAGL